VGERVTAAVDRAVQQPKLVRVGFLWSKKAVEIKLPLAYEEAAAWKFGRSMRSNYDQDTFHKLVWEAAEKQGQKHGFDKVDGYVDCNAMYGDYDERLAPKLDHTFVLRLYPKAQEHT
jgi:hypothetical protein